MILHNRKKEEEKKNKEKKKPILLTWKILKIFLAELFLYNIYNGVACYILVNHHLKYSFIKNWNLRRLHYSNILFWTVTLLVYYLYYIVRYRYKIQMERTPLLYYAYRIGSKKKKSSEMYLKPTTLLLLLSRLKFLPSLYYNIKEKWFKYT